WQQARDYVVGQISNSFDQSQVSSSGVFNLTAANFAGYNHQRSQIIGESDGSFTVNEEWYVINPSGSGNIGNAVEDFTVSVKYGSDSILTDVTIEGTVERLETKTY